MKNKTTMMLFASVTLLGILALTACASESISLVDTSWKLTGINGKPMLDSTEVTMEFTADQVGGNASCNRYFAEYTLDSDQLGFGMAGATRMMCGEEGVMDQETLFLSSLEKVESVSLEGNQLILHLNDGGSIVMVEQ